MKRMSRFLIALTGAAFASTGAGAAELKTMLTGDPRSFMPGGSPDDNSTTLLQHVYEGLVSWKADGSVAPMLAERIETSADKKFYTFTLRKGVKFHNGASLTPKEVVWTWNQFLEQKSAWACKQYFNGSGVVHVLSVEARGKDRVVFTLERPAPSFLSQMARSDCGETGIAHPDSVNAEGRWVKPIGTGPFAFESQAIGRDVVLTKFRDYAPRSEPANGYAGEKKALVDKIDWLIIPDASIAKTAIMAGQIDIWGQISPTFAEELKVAPGLTLQASDVPSINTFAIQTTYAPLDKPALRRAINYALDYDGMVASLTGGYAKVNTSPIPTSSRYYGDAQRNSFRYDPEMTKKLLAEAGYNGEKFKVTTNTNFGDMYDAGVLLQGQLVQQGLNAELDVVDFAAQLPRYNSGDYNMMTFDYSPVLDPALLLDRFIGSKAVNRGKVWDNPQARKLVDQIFATDPDKRQPLYDEIQRLYLEDAPMVVWSGAVVISAVRDNVKGYEAWAGRRPRFWNVEVSK
ncbi:ABC transporter substrate-binding protein [Rhizobium mongolense]|uniref:Peptide/nickel transport system substrate-binding protein n=1 Tax=Rhizobium mongolense TaxID=57676 RepID=A0A7W6RSI7_9HYPH|nr:ABC transporter substrate-binding protein [Rhizobium mongolense]MBB4277839.1 peptide/nickel transport system substrate-binding protein [Rhizobium mongolense]